MCCCVVGVGGELLVSVDKADTVDQGAQMIAHQIVSGGALAKFEAMCLAQGVSGSVATELCYGDKWKVLPLAPLITPYVSPLTAYIHSMCILHAICTFSPCVFILCLHRFQSLMICKHFGFVPRVGCPGDSPHLPFFRMWTKTSS